MELAFQLERGYMDLKVFKITALLLLAVSMLSQSMEVSEEELFEIGRKAIEEHSNARKEAFRAVFNGLSDPQKIRAIAYRVLASDDDPKHAMRASNSMTASYALEQDSDLIQDWNEIGKMMKAEQSPRKFFLLSTLATPKRSAHYNGFIAERTHMLFADGRVAKEEGEYTQPYAHDVSEYAYTAIVGNLQALGADFDLPAKSLPHEEKAVFLASWLKENWPGCGNIHIPTLPLNRKPNSQRTPPVNQGRIQPSEQSESHDIEKKAKRNQLPWIIAGVLLAGILTLLLKSFKGKLTP
jgi:hypothetical protein